jgi:outer membrane protein TolC
MKKRRIAFTCLLGILIGSTGIVRAEHEGMDVPHTPVEHVELVIPQGLLSGFPVLNQTVSMDEAVGIGLKNNIGIQVAGAESDIRRALLGQAQAKRWPVLSVGSNTFLHSRNNQTFMTPEMMMNTGESTFFEDLNASARMPLFTGGRITAGIKASRFSLEGAQAGTRQASVETAYQIRQAYLQALLSKSEHLVHQQHITVQQEMLKNAETRYQVGRGLKADVLRIQTEMADARRMLNEEHNQLNNALFDLKAAMGIDLGSEVTISDALSFTPWSGPQLPELVKAAVSNHPKVLQDQAAVKEAQAQVRMSRAAYLPQVYGQVGGNLRFRDDPPMMGNGVVGWVSASLPVLDKNRSADIAQALARLKKAQAEIKADELEIGKSVAQAWTDLQFAQENLGLADAAIMQAQEDFRLIRKRADVGRAIQVEVQDAALALREAGLNRAKAIYAYELAKAKLLEALGKVDESDVVSMGGIKP